MTTHATTTHATTTHATTTTVTAGTQAAPILDRLGKDWQRITVRAADLRTARGWGLPGTPVESLDDVLDRCGYIVSWTVGTRSRDARRAHPCQSATGLEAAHDAYMLALVAIAHDDRLAARIVLQRILPALAAVARRHSPTHAQQLELLDDLVANAWPSIRAYPVDRRPRRVVSNLVRDIGFQTIVRPVRRKNAAEVPTAHDRMHDIEDNIHAEPLDELIELLTDARRAGMSRPDIELVCQLLSLDRPEHVAVVLDVTPRTVRNHRDAIVRRLRSVAAAA